MALPLFIKIISTGWQPNHGIPDFRLRRMRSGMTDTLRNSLLIKVMDNSSDGIRGERRGYTRKQKNLSRNRGREKWFKFNLWLVLGSRTVLVHFSMVSRSSRLDLGLMSRWFLVQG